MLVKRSATACLWVAVVGFPVGSALGDIDTVYFNRTVFEGATTGLTTIDFNGLVTQGALVHIGGADSILAGGVAVTLATDAYYVSETYGGSVNGISGAFNHLGSPFYSSGAEFGTIEFDVGQEAFGLDIGALLDQTGDVLLEFVFDDNSTADWSVTITNGDYRFVGFTFTRPVETIEISTPFGTEGFENAIAYDNLTFGAVVIPAPGAAFLAVVGFGCAGWAKRKLA